jgi:hypothetical protein
MHFEGSDCEALSYHVPDFDIEFVCIHVTLLDRSSLTIDIFMRLLAEYSLQILAMSAGNELPSVMQPSGRPCLNGER